MNIGDEVKTNDGKVGKIEEIVRNWTSSPLDTCYLKGFSHPYFRWQLTPIPPEERKEWFWTSSRTWDFMPRDAALKQSKAAKRTCPEMEIRLFHWPDGEKVE